MQDIRERILNAAEARIMAAGPAGLVLGLVAADAGVSKGGLLYHFASKEALVGGLCDRMLERFDRTLEALYRSDQEHAGLPNGSPGGWARAYLGSTVTPEGKPADNSAQLMAGLLSTLGRDAAHLEAVRQSFARWRAKLEADGLDRTTATVVRLAADGLWLSALLGLPQMDAETGTNVVRALRELTNG